MTAIASRLKDALWSLRRHYGMETDIDRIIPYIVFEWNLSEAALNNLFVVYPRRIPEDFRAALIARIQQIIRQYRRYRQDKKGYHKVLKDVIFLENVARRGFEECVLTPDKIVGYRLELRKK